MISCRYNYVVFFVPRAKVNKISITAKKIPEKLFVSKPNVGLSLDAPSLLVGSKSDVNTIQIPLNYNKDTMIIP